MKWEMEILSPQSYRANWIVEESKTTKWSRSENKLFENALAVYDKDTPDRWEKVAEMIPGKTVGDVMRQYKELEMDVNNIEAGLVPVPGYESLKFKLGRESTRGYDYDGFKQSYGFVGKRSSSGTGRPSEQERRKGVPWTEEEHKLFLLGLKKYGKGDWRNISRNYVVTRTPTQVASHAQKYFIRQLSGGKDKRRASIHDITTVNLNESRNPSPNGRKPSSLDYPVLPHQQPFQWSHPNSGGGAAAAAMAFAQPPESIFIPSSYSGFGNKLQRQTVQRSAVGQSIFVPQNMAFQRYPVG